MKNIIRPFFFSSKSDKIKPPYFWATVFLALTVIAICFVIFGERSDIIPLIGILSGLVIGLMAIYNQGAKIMGEHVMVPVKSCVHCPHMYKCVYPTFGIHDDIPAKCPYRRDQYASSNNTIQTKSSGGL